MLAYEWPGNVRELENCIERAVALGTHNLIDVHDLPPALQNHSGGTLSETKLEHSELSGTDLEELERATIQRVFEETNGDKALTRRMLGISRATLYRKLKRYNIGQRLKSAEAAMSAP